MINPLRVLIVEDSEDDTELLVYQLERSGYDVIYQRVDNASCMYAALNQQPWDVVLADYALPRFNAIEALKILQSTGLDLPFIIVSGSIGDGIAVAAMKAGAHDYLLKENLARLIPAVEREIQEAANRKSLKESEDRWQLALQGSNDGIWDWDIKTNQVFFSARWKEMLGYENQEISDRIEEWHKRVHPEDVNSLHQALAEHLASKTEFYSSEHRLKCKNGCYKWILSRGQALWDAMGNPIRMVGSHTDISDRKQMEAALRKQAEDLAQANRLKDEFLAIVSHELRTPLNAILGWAQILRVRQLDTIATANALESIERNAKLQKQLVQDLLDVSRIIQGKMRLMVSRVSLIPIINNAIDTVQSAADSKGIKLQCFFDESVGLVSGDPDRLQQVLWNLLTNSIKFTPSGGRVEVRLSTSHKSKSEILTTSGETPALQNSAHGLLEQTNDYIAQQYGQGIALPLRLSSRGKAMPCPYDSALITVTDTGVGIKQEFLPYVFERFRQEDSSMTRNYGGLGLGLAIVRHLVELHGGTVSVYSEGEDKGTTFTVNLPLLEAEKLTATQPDAEIGDVESSSAYSFRFPPSPSLPLMGLQVLVVDDDADNREFLYTALGEYGADVYLAASASDALEALEILTPDVLLSDIGMPDQDGYSLIRQVKNLETRLGFNIPSVALTAYAGELDRTKAPEGGFQAHLPKPVEINELVSLVAKLAGRG